MGQFLDRILNDQEFWDEFATLLYRAQSGDLQTAASMYFDEPPGAAARRILKQKGVPETSVFSDYIRRFGGFPNSRETREAIESMVWALYGPPQGIRIDSSRQSMDEGMGRSLLTRSWVASALGAPPGTTLAVPMTIARSGAAAGELLQRFFSGQGAPGAAQLALTEIYRGEQSDPGAAASLVIAAIQIAGAGVYSYDTLRIMERMVYEALDDYRYARAEGKIGPDTNFIEYLLSHAAYWLNTYFPGLDPQAVLAEIAKIEQNQLAERTLSQAQPQPQPTPAPPPAPPEATSSPPTPVPSPPPTPAPAREAEVRKLPVAGSEGAAQRARNREERARERAETLPPPSYDPKYFETNKTLVYAKGPDNNYYVVEQGWDKVFQTWENYLNDPKAGSPWVPVKVGADEFIELYDGWRRANGRSGLSPAERQMIRSQYSILQS